MEIVIAECSVRGPGQHVLELHGPGQYVITRRHSLDLWPGPPAGRRQLWKLSSQNVHAITS